MCLICFESNHNKTRCPLKYDLDLRREVRNHLMLLDKAMRHPPSFERGKIIAALANQLEIALDRAERFSSVIKVKTKTTKNQERLSTARE